jgi:hypothetical protein
MMQNLFGDQSEDEEEADDDDVVEVVVDDDDQRQESPPQQQRHQELDDDEEGDARSHAHARSDRYHSVSPTKLPQYISLPPLQKPQLKSSARSLTPPPHPLAAARRDGRGSQIGACFLPTNPTHASPLSTHASRPPSTGAERDLQGIHLFAGAEIHPGFGRPLLLLVRKH